MKRSICAIVLAALFLLCLPVSAGAEQAEEPLRIAFIDSGISTKHIDPEHILPGRNYVFPEKDTEDRIGHGTAVAGLVLGAEDQGVEGLFPAALAVPLVVVDAYPSGVTENGGSDALCSALRDAVDDFGCRIINVSLSTAEDSEALREAVAYVESRGAVVVSAVGNDGAEGRTCYPAACETVIAVGSCDGPAAASFSQPGADVLAAGLSLRSATNRNSLTAAAVSGTSYSCAIVTALCAGLLSVQPELSSAEVRAVLFASAVDVLAPGYDAMSGWGVVMDPLHPWSPFYDVSTESWYYPGVLFVYRGGLMNGVGKGRFDPEGSATRAAVVTILWRMAGEPQSGEETGFTDVEPESWYAAAVRWAASEGVVKGYSPERFGPDDRVTREQLAVILYRYAGRTAEPATDAESEAEPEDGPAAELGRFADADAVSAWAEEALCWAVGSGLISGTDDARLLPGDGATRAQLAAVLLRLLSR